MTSYKEKMRIAIAPGKNIMTTQKAVIGAVLMRNPDLKYEEIQDRRQGFGNYTIRVEGRFIDSRTTNPIEELPLEVAIRLGDSFKGERYGEKYGCCVLLADNDTKELLELYQIAENLGYELIK